MPLPYPSGWFALAAASELSSQSVLTRRIAGEPYVLFRDGSGRPAAIGAYCPHLGAHMGHGGCVKGGTLVCPFHGFRFDREGTCVATGYGTKPPAGARVRSLPTAESGGWILAWYAPEEDEPSWSVPVLSEVGWTPLRHHAVGLATHPQETTENSVDLGHFTFVHGYRDFRMDHFETRGPYLHSRYAFTRPEGFPGFGKNLRIEISVHVWGLGFSYVDVNIPKTGLLTRQFVLPTAVSEGRTELRLGMALRPAEGARGLTSLLPPWALSRIVAPLAIRHYVRDVMQDRAIWENKIHLTRPMLATGDGPIGRYRRWCRQFYPGEAPASEWPESNGDQNGVAERDV